MSIEFDRSYIDEVLMLSGLALFLILAAVMPACPPDRAASGSDESALRASEL